MIWLPYASYPATIVSLSTPDLAETHDGLVLLAKAYNPRTARDEKVPKELAEWLGLFFEHQDSFYTFGLYAAVELLHRRQPARTISTRHRDVWARYWEKTRKFRRFINHPDWPEGFHTSMREALLQRDWEHYSLMFKASDEPFGEVAIEWPT